MSAMNTTERVGETCIDGGKCHHACSARCFRRECCEPFSDYRGPWKYPPTQAQPVTPMPKPAWPSGSMIRGADGWTRVMPDLFTAEQLRAHGDARAADAAAAILRRAAEWCDAQAPSDWYGRTAGDMVRAFAAEALR